MNIDIKTSLRLIRNFPRLVVAKKVFESKFSEYIELGMPPRDAEKVLLLANWASGGEFPRTVSQKYAVPFDDGYLKGFHDDIFSGFDPNTAVQSLTEKGYFVAPKLVDQGFVDDLAGHIRAGPAEPRDYQGQKPITRVPGPEATTWWMNTDVILQSAAVRRVLRERYPALVAGTYFNGAPMIMSLAMWRSFPSNSGGSASAQQFHYDGDRPLFLKMFIYLEDVTPENGPHVYVPGTQGRKPKSLLHGARLSDREIAARYPERSWAQICGPKGTVFFADTQGFHKGLNVRSGSRSILQVNLSADRFGPVYPPVSSVRNAPSDLRDLVIQNPRYFTELYSPE